VRVLFQIKEMTNTVDFDPYFDDEDVSFSYLMKDKKRSRFKNLSGGE